MHYDSRSETKEREFPRERPINISAAICLFICSGFMSGAAGAGSLIVKNHPSEPGYLWLVNLHGKLSGWNLIKRILCRPEQEKLGFSTVSGAEFAFMNRNALRVCYCFNSVLLRRINSA